jgi:hypothetical protein
MALLQLEGARKLGEKGCSSPFHPTSVVMPQVGVGQGNHQEGKKSREVTALCQYAVAPDDAG